MRIFRTTIIIISLVLASGCDQRSDEEVLGGRDVTQQFLTQYNGFFKEDTDRRDGGEELTISREGEIEINKIRHVGREHDPAIPDGTICNYVLHGQVRSVIELNETSRKRVDEEERVYFIPQTHNLTFSVLQVSLSNELRAGTTDNEACQRFQEEMNQRLPMYTYGMELFGSGQNIRLHTLNNDDVTHEGRGEGTTDENFERQ